MTALEIANARLLNQQIADPVLELPQQVVSWLGAMQAQEYAMAKWAIGLRLPRLHDGAVEQAFNQGDVLRTHVLRPTWHFVAPADIRWLLALTGPRVHQANAYSYRTHELDGALLARASDVLMRSLEGGRQLMRSELRQELARAGIAAEGSRLAHMLMHAELHALICSGPRRGKQFTYALLDERVPSAPAFDREQALAELARRYVSSRGPVALPDFIWWSGLPARDARAALATLGPEIQREQIDGREYLFPDTRVPDLRKLQTTFLLPDYDEYGISYKDRGALLGPGAAPWPARGVDVRSSHALVIDGRIGGTWRRIAQSTAVDIEPVQPLSERQQRAVTRAVARYRAFFEAPAL